jgi:hypothetical protein
MYILVTQTRLFRPIETDRRCPKKVLVHFFATATMAQPVAIVDVPIAHPWVELPIQHPPFCLALSGRDNHLVASGKLSCFGTSCNTNLARGQKKHAVDRTKQGGRLESRAQTASMLSYLGIQDALRKRHDSSQAPGTWADSVIQTGKDGTFVLTSQEKWDKAEVLAREIHAMLEKDSNMMNQKWLEQIKGFLQYVAQTDTSMTSYLIGFHTTIDLWQEGRDPEGWHFLPIISWRNVDKPDADWGGVEEASPKEAPSLVKAVPLD